MERPTIEIQLLKSGAKVILYETLTTGDKRKIRRASFAGMKFQYDAGGKPNLKDMDGGLLVDAEEVTLNCLLKEIFDKDGNKVENMTKFIYDLPPEDGDLLYDRANMLSENSALSEIAKKK